MYRYSQQGWWHSTLSGLQETTFGNYQISCSRTSVWPKMCVYCKLSVNFLSSVHNLSTVAVNEAGDTPLSLECSHGNLEMVKALINKHVDPNSKCLSMLFYVVDGGLSQSQSTRLVTPHFLWPTKVDTWKWSSISPSLITVIQKVNPISFQIWFCTIVCHVR